MVCSADDQSFLPVKILGGQATAASTQLSSHIRQLANDPQQTHTLQYWQPDDGSVGSRVVSVLDSGAEGPRFKSQSRRCRVTVLGKLFTPIMPLFTKQRN